MPCHATLALTKQFTPSSTACNTNRISSPPSPLEAAALAAEAGAAAGADDANDEAGAGADAVGVVGADAGAEAAAEAMLALFRLKFCLYT